MLEELLMGISQLIERWKMQLQKVDEHCGEPEQVEPLAMFSTVRHGKAYMENVLQVADIYIYILYLCYRIALVLGCLHLEKMEKQCKKMELENANLKEAHMTIAKKMGKQNAS